MKGAVFVFVLALAASAYGKFALPVIDEVRPIVEVKKDLGFLEGITKQTVGGKDIHYFRNIKFGDIDMRFAQPTLNKEEKGDESAPFDASRYGPQCQQGGSTPEEIQQVMESDTTEALSLLLQDEFDMVAGVANKSALVILHIAEEMFEVDLIGKTVEQVLRDVFDVDYSMSDLDCLQLAVSTPLNPTGTDLSTLPEDELLPVMFFVYGGGYSGGTQLKMDQARLGDSEDIVLVTVNYRVGPLGFLCLDDDDAAGNMGMLDMVTGLEWVQEYISYFGGDPKRVTVFGESAGAASIGHLVVSDLTEGLFDKGIGQSGSALSPWAFDFQGQYNARNMAHLAGCNNGTETDKEIVACMQSISHEELHDAYSDYKHTLRKAGYHGYQGSIPCGQSAGKRKFYEEHDTPHNIMKNAEYRDLSVMFGANSHEGSYVYGVIYKDYINENGLENDTNFWKYDAIRTVEETVGIDQSFDFDRQIQEYYFRDEDMGDPEKMAYGFLDILSVEFLKASSYEMTVLNADKKKMPSYFYSHEHASTKSLYWAMYFNDPQPYLYEPGVCHADELMMLFNLNLPIVLCSLDYLGQGLLDHAAICANDLGVTLPERPDGGPGELIPWITEVLGDVHEVAVCIAEPDSAFKVEYGECLFGTLTENELETSARMTKAWTNFAKHGTPTPDVPDSILPIVQSWTEAKPEYLAFRDGETVVAEDYKLTYNRVAKSHQGEDGGNTEDPNPGTEASPSGAAHVTAAAFGAFAAVVVAMLA